MELTNDLTQAHKWANHKHIRDYLVNWWYPTNIM